MKVGIDLSSTNTGLVILSDDNTLIWHSNFQLWDGNRFVIASNVADMINTIMCKRLPNEVINVGVELADFKNANITNRFNLLTGMIISELERWMEKGTYTWNPPLVILKLFNSNEWQWFLKEHYKGMYDVYKDGDKVIFNFYHSLIIDGIKIKEKFDSARKILKAMSRDFVVDKSIACVENWTEDECDAYCIAYFLEKLRDRTQMHQEVKAKKVQAKKSKVQELRDKLRAYNKAKKLYEIVNHYKDLATVKKLTKAQQRALEKAENELKELKNEKWN